MIGSTQLPNTSGGSNTQIDDNAKHAIMWPTNPHVPTLAISLGTKGTKADD